MEKLTVLQLSKRTGLSRTQIYYLRRNNKINIINGKIDLEQAMPAIIELLDKKSNKDSEVNFKQILNLLISQNISLQTQLNLAHEREKAYFTELASYRQNLIQKNALQPPTEEDNTQTGLENDEVDTGENSLNKMESESETQAPLESCQNINKETKSVNEIENYPTSTESIYNKIKPLEPENEDTELTRQEKEMIEQNDDALIGTPLPFQDDKEPLVNLKRHRHSKARVAPTSKSGSTKFIHLTAKPNKRKSSTDQPITNQNGLNKEDYHEF
ncbi:hypothetical protein F917_02527 [Acinetobacter baumannii NIPH 67]|uniref:hypothetical protein n=1 Tax=Acinetobacter baumannii TaxID=470 RepID=UPI0002D08734|nr:hypothetical protein [Acinetobacter baumannii]ENW48655.1 hypothetical protein F917_02527 [Acinetobacter baumannii NIPH 67]